MYDRHIAPLLLEALADTPVVLLNGARQTGKSTLAQSLREATPRRYLTLDDHTRLALLMEDVLDEITQIKADAEARVLTMQPLWPLVEIRSCS